MILLLTRVPKAPASRAGQRRRAGVFAGLRFVSRSPVFLAAITLDLFAVLFGGAVALLPIFAKDILQVGPAGLGWLRAAPGRRRADDGAHHDAAAAVGAARAGAAGRRSPASAWRRSASACRGSSALSLACLFLTGICDNISVVIRLTLEQMITPDALRGRVSAVKYVFIGFSNEIGAFESGATAALFGPIVSVVGGGLATIGVVGLVIWVWPVLARLGPLHTLRPMAHNQEP